MEQTKEQIIKMQDQIIGTLSREIAYLEDTNRRRKEWLRNAKKAAGYPDTISFDIVWSDALKALQSQSKPIV